MPCGLYYSHASQTHQEPVKGICRITEIRYASAEAGNQGLPLNSRQAFYPIRRQIITRGLSSLPGSDRSQNQRLGLSKDGDIRHERAGLPAPLRGPRIVPVSHAGSAVCA